MEGYTIGQVRAYGGAIDRGRIRRERALAILLRAASQYTPEDFEAFLKD